MSKFKVKTKSGEFKSLNEATVIKLLDKGSLKLATPILVVESDQWVTVSQLPFIQNSNHTKTESNSHDLKKLQLELQAEKEKNELLELALKKKTELLELLKEQLEAVPTSKKVNLESIENEQQDINVNSENRTSKSNGPKLRSIKTPVFEEEPVAEVDENLYEISGEKIWHIKGVEDLNDNYSILEIKDFRKQGKISNNTFLKKEGQWWKRYNDHYELHVPLQSVPFGDQVKVYIKKEQVRAPLKELIQINMEDKFNQGQMLNISIGGCQIKAKTKMQHMYTDGREIEIVFPDGSVLGNTILKGILRRVEEDEPNVLTCGVQFVDLTIKDKDQLAKIINEFTGDEGFAASA